MTNVEMDVRRKWTNVDRESRCNERHGQL